MLQNSNTYQAGGMGVPPMIPGSHGRGRPCHRSGFTLTELLVAMAIFVTLMGSLVTLFSGTVETTRAGYSRLASFEIGRTIVEVMKRDLGSAFTARDSGDNQQFYGQGNGFSFIGANENGELSRISYALVRVNDEKDFAGEMGEELGILVRRAMTQGTINSNRSNASPGQAKVLDGLIFAQNLVSALYHLGYFSSPAAALQAWNDLEFQKSVITAIQPAEWPYGPIGAPSYFPFTVDLENRAPVAGLSLLGINETLVVELEAVYQMASLVRYEENTSDLNTFTLPGGGEYHPINNPSALTTKWAKFNPNYHNQDVFDFNQSEGAFTNFWLSVLELSATNPNSNPVLGFTDDIRNSIYAQNYSFISPKVIDSILRAQRRKIWIDMLTNSYPPLIVSAEFVRFNFWQTQEMALNAPTINAVLANPLDYTVAEEFLQRVILRDSDTGSYTDINGNMPPNGGQVVLRDSKFNLLDLFGSPTFFSYAQGTVNSDGNFLNTFNSTSNIIGVEDNGNLLSYDAAMQLAAANLGNVGPVYDRLDVALLNAYTGFKSETGLQGSPLLPHIPSLIKVQFWVARHGVGVGDPPIKHWFAEVVDVPSGMTRKAKTTILADTGS